MLAFGWAMTTRVDPPSGSMLSKEPAEYDSNPALLDRSPPENDAPTAALNHQLWDTEKWAEEIAKQ